MRTLVGYICLIIVLFSMGCMTTPSYMGKYPPVCEYSTQVLAMPTCTATMEFKSPCCRLFRTQHGRVFYIGSPGAEREVMRFLRSVADIELARVIARSADKTRVELQDNQLRSVSQPAHSLRIAVFQKARTRTMKS